MEKRETSLEGFWDKPMQDLLQLLPAPPAEADYRRDETAVASLWLKQHCAGVEAGRLALLPSLLCQSTRHHPSRGQRHIPGTGGPGQTGLMREMGPPNACRAQLLNKRREDSLFFFIKCRAVTLEESYP